MKSSQLRNRVCQDDSDQRSRQQFGESATKRGDDNDGAPQECWSEMPTGYALLHLQNLRERVPAWCGDAQEHVQLRNDHDATDAA